MDSDEVIAATRLWLERAVIGLNLCPFAEGVYRGGRVRFRVSDQRSASAVLQELCGELVRLCLDRLDAPDLLSVDYKVPEFVRAVEAGAGAVVLVGAKDHDWVVGERQREGVDVCSIQGEADEQDAMLFEYFCDVGYRAAG